VSGIDTKGCEDVDSVEILTVNAPSAHFDTSMEAVCEGQRWTFRDRSRNNDSTAWRFEGRTVSGDEAEEVFPYGEEGEAMLIAVNEGKCRDTNRIRPNIPPFEEYLEARKPNVFTPNGDGMNDVFYLKTNGSFAPCTRMHIYNRWGQLLFKSSGNNLRWDAHTSAGKKVPPGTYFYTLIVNGVKIEGELQLME
jgi:gliding motility-associated-like protein